MEFLKTMTQKQLFRLYCNVWRRMTNGDGYQPYGYDARTLRVTKPVWFETLKMIALVHNLKQKLSD